jgi:hypothetical protein
LVQSERVKIGRLPLASFARFEVATFAMDTHSLETPRHVLVDLAEFVRSIFRLPSAFGMYRRTTACGRYAFSRNSDWIASRKLSTPLRSIAAIVWASTPAAPCSLSPGSTPRTGRHSCRCGRTARETFDPVVAWPLPAADLGGVVRFPPDYALGGVGTLRVHALARTSLVDSTQTPGTLPSGRVVLRGLRCRCGRYYDPLGLPLRRARFRLRLIRYALP